MARGRVQVRDLEAPEQIRPGAIVSPGFAAPPQAPIDNNLENLYRALGTFNSGLQAFSKSRERDAAKAEAEYLAMLEQQQLDEINAIRTASNTTELDEAYRAGITDRPDAITSPTIRKIQASDNARRVFDQIEQDIQSGAIEGFGTDGFDPDAVVNQRLQYYVDRWGHDSDYMAALAPKVVAGRENLHSRHREALGQARELGIRTLARTAYAEAWDNGLTDGQNGRELIGNVSKAIFPQLGPREGRGSLNIPFSVQNIELATMLDERLNDPQMPAAEAKEILAGLDGERFDPNGNVLPPLSAIKDPDVAKIVARVRNKAYGIAATAEADAIKEQAIDNTALDFSRGEARVVNDLEQANPYDINEPVKVKGAELKKEAAALWRKEYREQVQRPDGSISQRDYIYELDKYAANSVPHPDLDELKAAVATFSKASTSDPAGIQAAAEAMQRNAETFKLMQERAPHYVREFLGKSEQDIYTLYNFAVDDARMRPEDAVVAVTEATSQSIRINGELKSKINKAAKTDPTAWIYSDIGNVQQVAREIEHRAELFQRIKPMDAEEAVEAAIESVRNTSVIINGKVVLDTPKGFLQEDVPYIDKALKELMDDPDVRREMGRRGYDDISDLSVRVAPNGLDFMLTTRAGEPLVSQEMTIPTLELEQVAKFKAEATRRNQAEVLKELQEAREPSRPNADAIARSRSADFARKAAEKEAPPDLAILDE